MVKSLLLITLLTLAGTALAEPVPIDRVVAVVDKRVVLQSELEERLAQVSARARAAGTTLPDSEVLRTQVLDHLISEELQLAAAERMGLRLPEEHITATLENIRRSNNLSQEQLERELAREGLTLESFRAQLRRDLTLQQIQQGIVQQRTQVSDLEIDNFLSTAGERFWVMPEYRLGHILISLSSSPTATELREAERRAAQVVARIRRGESFASVAIAESDGPAALEGGDLGWRKSSDLPTLFADQLPRLVPGAVTEPIRSPAGFHILTLYDKRGDTEQTQLQAKVRHILLQPSAILTNEEAQAKLLKLREQILSGADFAALAKEHSEDLATALGGGELGWSKPGVFVPEFERTIAETETGEVSLPFRTRFGWHILQVQERREEDVSNAVRREKAVRILSGRRFEDELAVWLRELRDEAYVDVKL